MCTFSLKNHFFLKITFNFPKKKEKCSSFFFFDKWYHFFLLGKKNPQVHICVNIKSILVNDLAEYLAFTLFSPSSVTAMLFKKRFSSTTPCALKREPWHVINCPSHLEIRSISAWLTSAAVGAAAKRERFFFSFSSEPITFETFWHLITFSNAYIFYVMACFFSEDKNFSIVSFLSELCWKTIHDKVWRW